MKIFLCLKECKYGIFHETKKFVFMFNPHFLIKLSKRDTETSYLFLNLRGLFLSLSQLVPQGEDLPNASVPAARCHRLPIKWNILLDGGVDQATVSRLRHGHVALCHDLVRAGFHLLPLRVLPCVFLLQWEVDAGAVRRTITSQNNAIKF